MHSNPSSCYLQNLFLLLSVQLLGQALNLPNSSTPHQLQFLTAFYAFVEYCWVPVKFALLPCVNDDDNTIMMIASFVAQMLQTVDRFYIKDPQVLDITGEQ